MQGQAFTLSIQLFNQGWVVLLYELVEERLLRSMALVRGATRGTLAWRQHTGSTPTAGVLKRYTVEQSAQAWNI